MADGGVSKQTDTDTVFFIGVDNGYAAQKIAFWYDDGNGRKIAEYAVPSRAGQGYQVTELGGGKSSSVYEIGEERWSVGSHISEPQNTQFAGYATSNLNTVLVNHVLVKAGFGGARVKIATGLPFHDFYAAEGINTGLIRDVMETIRRPVVAQNGATMPIIVDNTVYPEATAAWIDYVVSTETGEVTTRIKHGAAIVDIGGHTTDINVIRPGEGEEDADRLDVRLSGTKEIGVLDVMQQVKREIMQKLKIDRISDAQVEQAIATGRLSLWGKERDVNDLIARASKEVGQQINLFMQEKIGRGGDLDMVLLVGGGANLLKDVIKHYHPRVVIPEKPQFCNARGMLKYMTFVEGDGEGTEEL